jgi:hypothetical protein
MRPTQRPGWPVGPPEVPDSGGEPQLTEQGSQYPSASRAREDSSGWATGFILFAGLMMIMVVIWQALEGLIAIFENEF